MFLPSSATTGTCSFYISMTLVVLFLCFLMNLSAQRQGFVSFSFLNATHSDLIPEQFANISQVNKNLISIMARRDTEMRSYILK